MDDCLLKIDNLSCTREGVCRLKNISFSCNRGENMVFFGPEDSGMDTLVSFILDLDRDYEGSIYYRGRMLSEFDYTQGLKYKTGIGYLHGDYGLISNMTVEDNISLPLKYHSNLTVDEIKKVVNRAVDELNLDQCKKLRPIDLSRSEILRTAYARSIIMDPDLLIVEHAFEGQCPVNILSFTESLEKRAAHEGRSTFIVTYHPEQFIEQSDRFVMFYRGRIVFSGNRRDFLESDNKYLIQYKNVAPHGPMVIL